MDRPKRVDGSPFIGPWALDAYSGLRSERNWFYLSIVEKIGWAVGYEDASSFRRLFKRTVGLTPGKYRRKFKVPEPLRSKG